MTDLICIYDVIKLTACQVDKAHLPDWFADLPDLRSNKTIVVVTWLRPEIVSRIGLPKHSICGFLTDPTGAVAPEQFIEYRQFVDAIHGICRSHLDSQLADFASKINDGNVALIDQRSPDVNAEIPTEDIIGTYRIKKGSALLCRKALNRGHSRLVP